jgi:preprotein translocase subunit SecA
MNFSKLYAKVRSSTALSKSNNRLKEINREFESLAKMSSVELTLEFQNLRRLTLEKRTIKGFAIIKEVTFRTLQQRQYDVQLLGGLTLLQGQLAEMRTGEGKTLTIVAPAALLALDGEGVHVVTANEYLAQRDADLLRPLYEALGLTVGFVHGAQSNEDKQAAYASDITYGISAEFGFDFLKDNMVLDASHKVQRKLHAAIVDEIDYVLIDEARVPLIIAENAGDISAIVLEALNAANVLAPSDVVLDREKGDASLTEVGYLKIEQELISRRVLAEAVPVYAAENLYMIRCVHAAIRAKHLFKKGRDYLVENNAIVLIDVGTGRKMEGRRLEDGLHEALEAQEGLPILPGTVTRATITFQNYFSQYGHLSGLTGTAATDAEEFAEVYGLRTVTIPTNKPLHRTVGADVVFLTKFEKFNAAVANIRATQAMGQPVLVGCASVRDAQVLSTLLSQNNIQHQLLSAQYKAQEAQIIGNAGKLHQVTVATNMAGRGTDIILGGAPPKSSMFRTVLEYDESMNRWQEERKKVIEAGGLRVLGTERNGLRRVDNQLAGRCGRQGEVGDVQFFLSLEDELLQNFSNSKKKTFLSSMLARAGGSISGEFINNLVQVAQEKREKQGFDARKELLSMDSVLGVQRASVYELRDYLLGEDSSDFCESSIGVGIQNWMSEMLPLDSSPENWDLKGLKTKLIDTFKVTPPLIKWVTHDNLESHEIAKRLSIVIFEKYRNMSISPRVQADWLLTAITETWTEHLTALDELSRARNLKSFSGLNPVFQFKNDAYKLFGYFEKTVQNRFLARTFDDKAEAERSYIAEAHVKEGPLTLVRLALASRWVLRNEPCPCLSGKPFKRCHGTLN